MRIKKLEWKSKVLNGYFSKCMNYHIAISEGKYYPDGIGISPRFKPNSSDYPVFDSLERAKDYCQYIFGSFILKNIEVDNAK